MAKNSESKIRKEAEPIQKTAATMADTLFAMLEKLAGEGSNLKVTFDQLTVGDAPMQAKVNGSIGLNVILPKD